MAWILLVIAITASQIVIIVFYGPIEGLNAIPLVIMFLRFYFFFLVSQFYSEVKKFPTETPLVVRKIPITITMGPTGYARVTGQLPPGVVGYTPVYPPGLGMGYGMGYGGYGYGGYGYGGYGGSDLLLGLGLGLGIGGMGGGFYDSCYW